MKKSIFIIVAAIALLLGGLTSYSYKKKILTSYTPEFKVAFIGDQGLGTTSRAVLELIRDEHTDLLLHQGDFDYENNPEAWYKETTNILGEGFPLLGTLGNHDVEESKNLYDTTLQRLVNEAPDLACWGKIGSKVNCHYENLNIVSVAPGVIPDDYGPYIQDAFTTNSNTWNICVWHKNQHAMQVGDKKDETGWDVYKNCKKAGAMIVTAHEHSYSRTYLLDALTPLLHIATTSSTMKLEPGKSFVVVSGMGGESIRPQTTNASWWATVYSATQNADPGALFCVFNYKGDTHRAECYFKDINYVVADKFTILR